MNERERAFQERRPLAVREGPVPSEPEVRARHSYARPFPDIDRSFLPPRDQGPGARRRSRKREVGKT